MEMPQQLQERLKKLLATAPAKQLHAASDELSARYRTGSSCEPFMANEAHRLAYLAARMPATYAAVYTVLQEWKKRQPNACIATMLDMGAGPATAYWATKTLFPSLEKVLLVEQDNELAAVAKQLLDISQDEIAWECSSMELAVIDSPFDLAIFSYSIGELPEEKRLAVIAKAWAAAQTLIVVEPGTPAGFERIRAIRRWLIEAGACLLAPCPNGHPCPMDGGDWCHFSVRLERTPEHRQAKGVTLGYEDEKFSYLIAGKEPGLTPSARILRHPQKRSGHLNLTLCTEGKVVAQTISRRDGPLYKAARKLEWGDAL